MMFTYLAGGGLFPGDNWKAYLRLFLKFFIRKFFFRKNIVYGVDICKVSAPLSKRIWKLIGLFSDAIVVRNKHTVSILNDAGLANKLYSGTDITFGMETPAEKSLRESQCHAGMIPLLSDLNIKLPYIVVVLAKPWTDDETENEPYRSRYIKLCAQMIQLCNRIIEDGFLPVFLPFFHENDRDFIRQVVSGLHGQYRVCEENELPVEEKRLLFARAEACLSMRFHGIAFSLYYGIPCEAVCYAPKSLEMMNEAGLGNYCVQFGIRKDSCFFQEFDIDNDSLMRIYDDLLKDGIKEKFKAASEYYKELAGNGEKLLLDVLCK